MINLGLRRAMPWRFILADVTVPILGADFLQNFNLLVDLKGKRLVDGTTGLTSQGGLAKLPTVGSLRSIPPAMTYVDILEQYPEIFRPGRSPTESKVLVTHVIETKGPPVFAKARRLAPDKLKDAKLEFQVMCDQGICRPSKSPWASPLHMVKKKDGPWRPCGDYRALNNATIPDRYPLPNIADLNANLHGCTIFSKIDLLKAYHQVPVDEGDVEKTAVITPFGLFEFPRMPFGLRNAAQTFQRVMNQILRDCPFAFSYLDDILVGSKSDQEHRQHLHQLFKVLQDNGLQVNVSKSVFGVEETDFLGYTLNSKGIRPQEERVKIIKEYPKPKEVHELRRFLGLINFYRRCLPHTAGKQKELFSLIPDNKKKDHRIIKWTEKTIKVFNQLKNELEEATLLAHPDLSEPLCLTVDSSQTSMGAALQQKQGTRIVPLAFFSQCLNDAQKRYSTYDRELLAIYTALKHFRPILEGQQFVIFTDHRPLTNAFDQSLERASPRQQRQLEYISQFSTDIRYVPGGENSVADALSRIASVSALSFADTNFFLKLAEAQENDKELQELRRTTSLQLRNVPIVGTGKTLVCDSSTGQDRPYLTPEFRENVFNQLHNQSHPGIRATIKLVAARYIWPGLRSEIRKWARACIPCQRSKVHRHIVTPVQSFPVPKARFLDIHLDIVGPLPPSQGYRYLLTMVDRYTRWMEAVPLVEITAAAVAEAFYREWISRYGTPETVVTDQGRQFEADLFRCLGQCLGFTRKRTTPYHPQSNGLVERLHRSLKSSLMAALTSARTSWTLALPATLLGLRTVVKEDLGTSAAELVFGQPLRLPGEFFEQTSSEPSHADLIQSLRQYLARCRPTPPRNTQPRPVFVHKSLEDTQYVFLRVDAVKPPLTAPYQGPYKILNRTDKTVTLDLISRTCTVSLDRVKPCHLLPSSSDTSTSNSQTDTTRTERKVKFVLPKLF